MIIMSGRQSYSTEKKQTCLSIKDRTFNLLSVVHLSAEYFTQSNNHKHLCHFMPVIKLS